MFGMFWISPCIQNKHEKKKQKGHTLLLSSEISRTASVTPSTPVQTHQSKTVQIIFTRTFHYIILFWSMTWHDLESTRAQFQNTPTGMNFKAREQSKDAEIRYLWPIFSSVNVQIFVSKFTATQYKTAFVSICI